MHNYLRAIGFSNLQNEKDIKEILTEVFHDFDEREVSREGKNKAFVEYTKSFGENMGIKMCGIMDTDGFHQELIVHRRAFIQPQTLLPAFIRKFFRFITVTLYRQWKKERVWYLDTL